MADDDKKRTQEGSETNFTTRGGRQDEGGGVLAFIDELFWLEEHWSLPPPASQN